MAINVGRNVSNFLGFDPTPGFNLSSQMNGESGKYGLTATGTTNLFGRNPGPSSGSYVDSLNQRVANAGVNGVNTNQGGQQVYPQSGGGGAYSGGGGGRASAAPAAPTSDPQLAAQYQDVINQYNQQLNGLGGVEQNGIQSVQNSYNQATGQLQQQYDLQNKMYGQQKQQNTQEYQSTRNNAATQVRAQGNALQRLLGMNGAGNSSAAYEQAPYAAALQGSQLINGAQQTYSKNAANADNNWAQTELTAKQKREQLNRDKQEKESSVRSKVAETRMSLLDQIRQNAINRDMANGKNYKQAAAGQAGLQGQQQALLGRIQELGRVNPINFDASGIQYKTADMGEYSLDGFDGPSQAGPEGNVDGTFLSLLGQKKRDAYGNPVAY